MEKESIGLFIVKIKKIAQNPLLNVHRHFQNGHLDFSVIKFFFL